MKNIESKNINLIEYIDKSKKNDFIVPINFEGITIKCLFGMMLNIPSLCIKNSKFTGFYLKEVNQYNSINIQGSIVHKELLIKDCTYNKFVNFFNIYCLGDVIIDNCIFEEFVDFGDCWFKNNVIIRNNTFKKGTNLLGNLDRPYKVTFDKKPTIENNIGNLEMNILTE